MTPIRFVLRHQTLRLITVALLLLGALNASVYPYQSVIAIERIGMTKPAFSLMLAFPGFWALVLCQGVLLPLASSLYGQVFALARLASPTEGHHQDGILGAIRSAMALTFLAILIFWTFAFGYGMSEMAVYVSAGLASLGLLILISLGWAKDGQTPWADPRSGMRLRDALAEIAKPNVAVPGVLISLLGAVGLDFADRHAWFPAQT